MGRTPPRPRGAWETEPEQPVGPHLQQEPGEDDAARGGRLRVRVGEPAMDEEHGHLDGKPEKQRQEDPELDFRRILHLHESQHVERAPDVVQGQNPSG